MCKLKVGAEGVPKEKTMGVEGGVEGRLREKVREREKEKGKKVMMMKQYALLVKTFTPQIQTGSSVMGVNNGTAGVVQDYMNLKIGTSTKSMKTSHTTVQLVFRST